MSFKSKVLKLTFYIFAISGVFTFLYFALAGIGLLVSTEKKLEGEKKYTIYMATGGIHADFILPYKSDLMRWSEFVSLSDYQELRFIPKYIQVGWGERGFYLDMIELENLTPQVAIRAAFLPSKSLMHVTYHGQLPKNWYELKKVEISKAQYTELIKHVKSGFQMKAGKPILVPNKGYYNQNLMIDNFYEGVGSYHLFNTCNMWTVRGMRKAGLRTSIFSPFKYGVTKFLD